jgi:hypothetical protein
MVNASGSDGRYRPFSMEITVCRDTPSAAASSACDSPRAVRCSRTRFRIMSSDLYSRDMDREVEVGVGCRSRQK